MLIHISYVLKHVNLLKHDGSVIKHASHKLKHDSSVLKHVSVLKHASKVIKHACNVGVGKTCS